jgi:hypothetical protein
MGSPKEDNKSRVEVPKEDSDLASVQVVANDMNGQHEQLQEIKLD